MYEEMVDSTAMNHLIRNQILIRRLLGKVAVARRDPFRVAMLPCYRGFWASAVARRRDPHWTENSFC